MKNIKSLLLISILFSSFACGSKRYIPVSPDPIITDPEDKVVFTNVFEYSLDLNTNAITNVYNNNNNLVNSTNNLNIDSLSTKRTFYDFFFYNQVLYTLPQNVGQRGADFDAHLSNDQIISVSNDEKAYWSYNEISNIANFPGDFYYDSIGPIELANLRKVLLKFGLNIDKDGYINKNIGRILVALISPQNTVSLRLDLNEDMEITDIANSSNKEVYANFSDDCAVVEFRGIIKSDNNGNLIVDNVSLSFNNHSDAYTDPTCNYFGQIKVYDNSVMLNYIELPYTRSATLNNNNINPYNVVVKGNINAKTKDRVLFQNVIMHEIQE